MSDLYGDGPSFEDDVDKAFLLKLAQDHSPFMAHLTYEMTRGRGEQGLPTREEFLRGLGEFSYFDSFFLSYLMLLRKLEEVDPELSLADHAMVNLTHLLTGEPQVDHFLHALMANTSEEMEEEQVVVVGEHLERLTEQELTGVGTLTPLLLATVILKLARSLADATQQEVDEVLRKLALGVQLGDWNWRP